MSAQEVRSFIEGAVAKWNAHDRQGYLALSAEDQVTTAPGGMRFTGRQGAEQFYDSWQKAFPDCKIEVQSIVADDSAGCLEGIFTGTHTGAMMSPQGEVPPTGKRVRIPFSNLVQVRNGKSEGERLYFDSGELVAQLGLVPSSAAV